jgi:type IV secretion system protein VirD4
VTIRQPDKWDVLREARHWPWKPGLAGLAIAGLGFTMIALGAATVGQALLLAGTMTAAAVTIWWAWDRLFRPLDSAMVVVRGREHSNHNQGAASKWDTWQSASREAMRAQARILRPSLAALTDRQLRQIPVTEYAALVATTGYSIAGGGGTAEIWSSCEDVTLRSGGPRRGKSGSLAAHVVDAPGAVLCTSTRTDLLNVTREVRAQRGKILIFNPTGLGKVPSTVRWSPLSGCDDFPTAQRRAEAMIKSQSGESEIWAEQARRILAVLFHAAARKGARMQKVADWLADASDLAGAEIIAALQGTPNALALVSEVSQFMGTNDKTKTSITTTAAPALRWLANTRAAEVGDAPDGDAFNVRDFIEQATGTLYLIGSPETAPVTPLISALTAEVAHQLRMVAGDQPSERLDPPFTAVLDEMTLAIPELNVAQWTADMGGRGVTMHLSIQSLAQMRGIWGADRASEILNNVSLLLVFGGTKSAEDLEALTKITGQRLETLDEDDARYTALLDPATISALPKFQVLVFSPGLRPMLGWAPQIWQRRTRRTIWRPAARRRALSPKETFEPATPVPHLVDDMEGAA